MCQEAQAAGESAPIEYCSTKDGIQLFVELHLGCAAHKQPCLRQGKQIAALQGCALTVQTGGQLHRQQLTPACRPSGKHE